jgi:DNA (cytosine-5)-methyltransferase 1
MKVLNLYAGIGGNRKLWPESCKVTAIENDPDIAKVYKDLFPQDEVIVTDAHKYLLDHFKEFDFIWSSPPCPSHSRTNFFLSGRGVNRYPDMTLYQEILFLKHFFKGKWVIENVVPYYKPLIEPNGIMGRHFFWSNFQIKGKGNLNGFQEQRISNVNSSSIRFGFNLEGFDTKKKRVMLRNLVDPEIARSIFEMAFKKEKQEVLI